MMMGTVPISLSLGPSDEVESLVKEWIVLVMERDRLFRECLNQVTHHMPRVPCVCGTINAS